MKSKIERRRYHQRTVNMLGLLVFTTLTALTLTLLSALSPPALADTITE
jgi:hypothetical protein